MELNEQEGVTSTHRRRLKVVGVVGTAALVGLLVVSQVTSSHSSARAAAAATAWSEVRVQAAKHRSTNETNARALVLVSHPVHLVRHIADRVTVLDFGQVLAEGTPDEIVSDRRVVDAFFGESHES